MIKRRNFIALCIAGVLAACSQSQMVQSGTASTLSVTEVVMDMRVRRKNTALPKEQIEKSAQSRLYSTLSKANPSGSRPVRAEVAVLGFYIANPAAGILIGSSVSSIQAQVTLVDIATNKPIGEPFNVAGSTEVRPTIFGAFAIKSPEQEVATITADLAQNTKTAIYGK